LTVNIHINRYINPVKTKIKIPLVKFLKYKYRKNYDFGFCMKCHDIFVMNDRKIQKTDHNGYFICDECEA